MKKRTKKLLLLCALATTPRLARAEITHFPLAPPLTPAEFTTYAMGLFPLPGHFTRFTGDLAIDPAHPDTCTVALTIDIASLEMADPARTRLALGPKLLDQPAFPQLTYLGTCAHGQAAGQLTLHGVTRPLALATTRQGALVTATSTLKREDYGIDGLPALIGRTIKLTFTVQLPPDIATLVRP